MRYYGFLSPSSKISLAFIRDLITLLADRVLRESRAPKECPCEACGKEQAAGNIATLLLDYPFNVLPVF